MTTKDEPSTPQKITIGLIFCWVLGSLLLLSGVMLLFSDPIPAIFTLLASFLLLPPIQDEMEKRVNVKLSGGVRVLLALVLMAIGGTLMDTSSATSLTKISGGGSTKEIVQNAPLLELQSLNVYKEYSFARIEGSVKNISDESMESVMAVGIFTDEEGNMIKSADALIDYNPILPGQVSPFEVLTSDNPAIKRGEVTFKEFFGGTIPMRDGR